MTTEAVFTYFEGRGLGELIRIALCVAKIPFKQKFVYKSEDLEKLKAEGKLYFGQLPLLELDGLNLTQSNATVRYVADKGNLIPQDAKDRFRMNMLFDGARDAYAPFLAVAFVGTLEELKPKIQKSLDRYLPIFDKALTETGTGYLVGSSVTLADVALLQLVLASVDYFGEEVFEKYPNVQTFLATMKAKPEVVTYIENIRQRPNDDRYVQDVKAVLPPEFWNR